MLLVSAGNGVRSGGRFLLTPTASLTDGLLDVCFAEAVPLRRVFALFVPAMRGQHLGAPEVHYRRTTAFHLITKTPLPLHADGEVLTRATCQIEWEIVPGGLSVLMPV